MSFRFNFNSSEEKNEKENLKSDKGGTIEQFVRQCMIHLYDSGNTNKLNANSYKSVNIGEDHLLYLDEKEAEVNVQSTDIASCLHHSDLSSGSYEGGLKVWECTYDLLHFMSKQNDEFKNKNVLDLGCGAGLLGIYAAKCAQAKFVAFQDYNCEVIENFTIPTVKSNMVAMETHLYISGDWDSISVYLRENNLFFDIILSSETIYNQNYYEKICNILQNNLQPNGYALFAAKSYYFGVGGGVLDFTEHIKTKTSYQIESVWETDSGLRREILKVSRNNHFNSIEIK